jgi:hypothetical protein
LAILDRLPRVTQQPFAQLVELDRGRTVLEQRMHAALRRLGDVDVRCLVNGHGRGSDVLLAAGRQKKKAALLARPGSSIYETDQRE